MIVNRDPRGPVVDQKERTMPIIKFTDKFIKSVGYEGKVVEYTDANPLSSGLKLVVYQTSKTFMMRYRDKFGKKQSFKLGGYPAMSLKEARDKFLRLMLQINNGDDPALDRRNQRKDIDQALKFKEVCLLYMKRHAELNLKEKTVNEYYRELEKDVYPKLGGKLADELSKRDIVLCIDAIEDRGKHVLANRVTALIKAICNWACKKDIMKADPAHTIEQTFKERARKNVLDDNQIRVFWNVFDSEGVQEATSIVAKLELLTGARTGEISQRRKDEIDLTENKAHWITPDTKNKTDHMVPLSQSALELIKRAFELSGNSAYLFPSPVKKNGDKPIRVDAVIKAIARRRGNLGFEFTSHDLRRTLNTRLAKMGVSRDMRERILNHSGSSQDINDAVYNWHKYEDEIRKILEAWAQQLVAIIENRASPSNVVKITG